VETAERAVIRQMQENDLASVDELRRLAGWNQTLEDWRWLLSLEPEGCFVAAQDAKVIGTVTTISYEKALGWIGMMLVHPDYQRQGIATRLMRRALDYLSGCGIRCIKLDATPAGRPLYEKLGFTPECTLTRYQGTAARKTANDEGRELAEDDWPTIDRIDTAAFGVARTRLLRSLVQRKRSALVWPREAAVQSWGILRPGATADYLGPVVGAGTILRLLQAAGNRSVLWDIPDVNEAAKALATQLGFAPLRALTRMRLGPSEVVSDLRSQFAIADPSVG
jgi:predicted N-acetyltransferase YhbS